MRIQPIVFAILVACLSGCVAHMVEKHGDSIQLIKLGNERPGKGGVIRYLNGGLKSWRSARRSDAERQMKAFCSGPYRIVEEGPRSKFGADMPIGNSVSVEFDEYTYVRFDCEK